MIDDQSQAGAWERALQPDNRSLRFMAIKELHDPLTIERVRQWKGLATAEEACTVVADELKRRTIAITAPLG